jgi:hypothetical protein
LATDPLATSTTVIGGGAGWKTSRWFGTGGGAGTHTLITNQTDGPAPNGNPIRTYLRKQWTSSPTANSDTGFDSMASSATGLAITPGKTYTVSCYLRPSSSGKTNAQVSIYWRDASGNQISRVFGPTQTPTAGVWIRIAYTATAPSNAAVGDYLDGTGLLIEESTTTNTFFAGDTPDTANKLYQWTGAANNSTSTESSILAKPASEYSLDDLKFATLQSQVADSGSMADIELKFLKSQVGKDGTLADLQLAYFKSLSGLSSGTLQGRFRVRVLQAEFRLGELNATQ